MIFCSSRWRISWNNNLVGHYLRWGYSHFLLRSLIIITPGPFLSPLFWIEGTLACFFSPRWACSEHIGLLGMGPKFGIIISQPFKPVGWLSTKKKKNLLDDFCLLRSLLLAIFFAGPCCVFFFLGTTNQSPWGGSLISGKTAAVPFIALSLAIIGSLEFAWFIGVPLGCPCTCIAAVVALVVPPAWCSSDDDFCEQVLVTCP